MYSTKKLEKLLKKPLKNFHKLVRLYVKHLVEHYRIKYGELDENKKVSDNLESIEEEFDLYEDLTPYLKLNKVVKKQTPQESN